MDIYGVRRQSEAATALWLVRERVFNPFPLTPTLSPRRGRIVVLFGTIRIVSIFRRAGKWLCLSLGRGLG